jgi:predicted alpha/beta hydrolase family esterase
VKSQKQTIFNIHGAGPKHYRSLEDGSGDWQSKLSKNLGNNYKYLSPQMPSPTQPKYEDWKELFEKYLTRVRGEEVVFVGHSLGGSFLLKYLSQNQIKLKIAGLFLVAAPLSSIKGFEAPVDYSALANIPNIHLYHSMDDVEVPYAHALIYREKLKANLKTYTDRGHFFKRGEFTDLIHDIQTISPDQGLFF